MANIFEKTGMGSKAMDIYDKMDPNDPAVKHRQNQILHRAAIKMQAVFRGHQARAIPIGLGFRV